MNRPAILAAREAMQRRLSAELGIDYDPRWKSSHCTHGSCTYCTQVLCTHRCHGNATGDENTPGSRPRCSTWRCPVPADIRLSEQARNQLATLVRRTGIRQRNVLLRWAFCRSIAEPNRIAPYDIPFDPAMPPIAWDTFGGYHADAYWALLRLRVHADGLPLDEDTLRHQFLLHLHRGCGYLAGNPDIRDISSLMATALAAADEHDREEAHSSGRIF